MTAPQAQVLCVVALVVTTFTFCAASMDFLNEHDVTTMKIELFDGVYASIPVQNNETRKLISFEIDTKKDLQEGRGKKKDSSLMQRILPMFIMPFLIQSAIVPMFLSMLKFMLFKSMMVGKIALGLILLNAFKNHNSFKGRRDAEMADIHYGYQGNGMEEYGAYVN